ncbi:YjcZ family sporulation protein [Mesobacillus boroniphilus]|uniref:YjcZ family sporulation protein n=1 Tax=Mesobacillus boroniphilus TaxID=308892 RepID=A0A944CK40_9BACI|nr:YjcZ family sporulation protein [Mesobacillus boroniphilus]MBS8264566.1 YjcZ family sporulation protein [Mesobacillus boroniphilus]
MPVTAPAATGPAYGTFCGGGYPYAGVAGAGYGYGGFALIVVLFILLIIIGACCSYNW